MIMRRLFFFPLEVFVYRYWLPVLELKKKKISKGTQNSQKNQRSGYHIAMVKLYILEGER